MWLNIHIYFKGSLAKPPLKGMIEKYIPYLYTGYFYLDVITYLRPKLKAG